MLIKPPIKTNSSKLSICSWIIEKFPVGYEDMSYIEPFIGNGSIFLNKLKSKEEVASDLNKNIIYTWKAIRDENKSFRSKLSKLKYNEKSFAFIKNKKIENDYFKEAFKDFTTRKMSKATCKETYEPLDRKKANKIWKETADNLLIIEKRIKDAYFLNRNPAEIISSFDNQNTLCFCCPPPMTDDKKAEMTTDDYVKITDAILSFRGKVVFCGNACTFYRRIFKEWKLIKKKSTAKKADCLWINF